MTLPDIWILVSHDLSSFRCRVRHISYFVDSHIYIHIVLISPSVQIYFSLTGTLSLIILANFVFFTIVGR